MGDGNSLATALHWHLDLALKQERGSLDVGSRCKWCWGATQLNIPHHGGWAAIRKGAQGKVAPDLWHHLPEEEWSRLQLVQVPWKLLKDQQEDVRGKKQYIMAKEVAARRANLEQPTSLENELKVEDQLHFEVYQVAGQRIGAILQDKHHYMNGKLERVPEHTTSKAKSNPREGRVEVLRQLTQRPAQKGAHQWQMHNNGVKCSLCHKKIKACATFAEIGQKQDTACSGFVEQTMEQQLRQLVDESSLLAEGQEGHRWYLHGNHFGCHQCWEKIPRRSGKHLLQKLQSKECIHGPVDEAALNIRQRIHPSHALMRKGTWLECQQCRKYGKIVDGRIAQWVHQPCLKAKGQRTLIFGPGSSDS